MIFDVERFISEHRPVWRELEGMLDQIKRKGFRSFDFKKAKAFYNLYNQVASDLSRIQTFSSELELTEYLEGLISRAYSEIYSIKRGKWRIRIKTFFSETFPDVFRQHIKLFNLALIVLLIGAFFGGIAIMLDPQSKDILIRYGPLKGSPYQRVLREEQEINEALDNQKLSFSSYLITHNIRVALFTLLMGITFGIGTMFLLFYNGILLGAVVADYIRYGVGTFAVAWLLPHGAFEIWTILIAGQAGFLIAKALLKSGKYSRITQLTMAGKDILTLFLGLSTLLIWAGIVEAFFSQYHEPLIPYPLKITFGILELLFLCYYFFRPSSKRQQAGRANDEQRVNNQ